MTEKGFCIASVLRRYHVGTAARHRWALAALGALVVLGDPATAQSPVDLVRMCADAVTGGQPPVLERHEPTASVGEAGDTDVARAWEALDGVAYLEFLSHGTIYDDVDRTAHECRFELSGADPDLTPILAEMTAVMEEMQPYRALDTGGVMEHAMLTCRDDGLPLTLTVQRDDAGALWIAAWDTTWGDTWNFWGC